MQEKEEIIKEAVQTAIQEAAMASTVENKEPIKGEIIPSVHDHKGRFKPGHQRTNAYKSKMTLKKRINYEFRQQFESAINKKDFRSICNSLVDRANNAGGAIANQACEIIFKYLIGKPPAEINANITTGITPEQKMIIIKEAIEKKLGN
jgi:hypothetical protein